MIKEIANTPDQLSYFTLREGIRKGAFSHSMFTIASRFSRSSSIDA